MNSRSSVLASTHSPDTLAAHVAAELRAQRAGDPTCTGDQRQWLAPCYRWNLIWLALIDHNANNKRTTRHPRSGE